VSTSGDERSVYIASDNKTVYFSSNGHGGFGKLDIFKTMWNGTNTDEPVNIGKPFNTVKNDMGFVISGRGEAAYFIRDLDIYYADINDSKASLKPDSSTVVFGEITLNNKPAQSLVRVLSGGLLLGETSSDEDGKYSLVISGSFSSAEVLVDGSLGTYQSQYIESESELYQEFEIDFSANHSTEEKVDTFSTSNEETDHLNSVIYFEFDQFDVPTNEVYKLKKILRSINQSSVIFIAGHTDHLGKNQYNFDLSKKRVIAVQDYIVEFSGLSKNQFVTKFEGERKVLNEGATSNQRSMNRRVTVKVMNH
jgi:outer membrane protein OmpA-like peptidoglycan-associated protein